MRKHTRRIRQIGVVAVLLIAVFVTGAGTTVFAQQQPQPQTSAQQSAQISEHKLTAREAGELFKSVDEILEFVSKDTGLPIKHKVKRQLANRDEVVKYVEKKLAEDEDTQRLERSAISLKKFGLLPRDFELRPYLLSLLKEQVAGFYDSKTKTVYLLDWVEPEAQKSVLAHELTHALQDQNYGLEKWGEWKGKPKTDQEIIANDEAGSAKQAVIEGQAMITLLDYSLAPMGGNVVNSPAIVEAMKAGMVTGEGTSPLFERAPLFLRQALIFPYQYGIDFVRSVLIKRGKQGAFAGTMENPPVNSRQIMMPDTYLAGEKIAPMAVPDIDKILGKAYTRYDFGGIGQFDIGVMMDQWSSPQQSTKIAPSWRGGYYWTGRQQGVTAGPVAMVFVTRWASEKDATEFAHVYAQSLGKRYRSVQQVKAVENGKGEWKTEEGPARVATNGELVSVVEGFDTVTSDRLETAALAGKSVTGAAAAK